MAKGLGCAPISFAVLNICGGQLFVEGVKVRLVRDSTSGLIQVFFDNMDRPAMTAHDRTFGKGRIGVGSFDDTGMFDEIVVRERPSHTLDK